MSKHTPGPWSVALDDRPILVSGAKHEILSPDGVAIGTAYRYLGGPKSIARSEANARLIAAAPELLELLRRLSTVYDQKTHGSHSEIMEAVARAKALVASLDDKAAQ